MAIANYTELLAKVALWLDRDDLTAVLPDFVGDVETELNRRLRLTDQQSVVETTAVPGLDKPLPLDCLRISKVYLVGSPDRPLRQIAPNEVPVHFGGEAGIPQYFYIEEGNIYFAPPIAENTTLGLTYYTKLPSLGISLATNWLLTSHPDIYRWGVIREAAAYIRDPEALSYASSKFDQLVEQLITARNNDKWGNGPLYPIGPTQVRGGKC